MKKLSHYRLKDLREDLLNRCSVQYFIHVLKANDAKSAVIIHLTFKATKLIPSGRKAQ